jgi:hypothetical protein
MNAPVTFLHAEDIHPDVFDESDDSDISAIAPYELVEPIGELLRIRSQIEAAERIGGLNKERALDWLRPELDRLYRACVQRYRDL